MDGPGSLLVQSPAWALKTNRDNKGSANELSCRVLDHRYIGLGCEGHAECFLLNLSYLRVS